MPPITPQFYLRLGIAADKVFFEENKTLYHGVIVNARILESFPKSTAAFLNTLGKPFVVDPDTYTFKLDPSMLKRERDLQLKRSYSELRKFYDSVIDLCLKQDRSLYPSDFLLTDGTVAAKTLEEFASNVIKYEKTRVDSLIGGLVRFLEETNAHPSIVMAPYFDFSSIHDPWYRISLELAHAAAQYKDKYPLFPVICAERGALSDPASLIQIVNDYEFNGFDGYFLWVPDFNEDSENIHLLTGYAQLVRGLQKYGKPVIGMYGKFFSALLFYVGMTGFSSGINYWDKRSLELAGGGPPFPRYYVPLLHTHLPWEDVNRMVSQEPSLACDCPACKEASLASQPSMDLIKTHFLYARYQELVNVAKKKKKAMTNELLAVHAKMKPLLEPLVEVNHLERWAKAISAV